MFVKATFDLDMMNMTIGSMIGSVVFLITSVIFLTKLLKFQSWLRIINNYINLLRFNMLEFQRVNRLFYQPLHACDKKSGTQKVSHSLSLGLVFFVYKDIWADVSCFHFMLFINSIYMLFLTCSVYFVGWFP